MKDFKFDFKVFCYLVCGYNEEEVWKNFLDNNKDSGEVDIFIIMIYMMLMVEEFGLGICWIGYFDLIVVKKNLEIFDNIKVIGILSLGYYREDDRFVKLYIIYRNNEDLVKFL